MILTLILLPAAAALAAGFLIRSDRVRRALLVATALGHSVLTGLVATGTVDALPLGDAFGLDGLGKLFLSITSALFLAASVYAVGYLSRETQHGRSDFEESFIFSNAPEATFTGCLLGFLSTMSLVAVSRHFSWLWVGIEATTLASAPLIYFHRHHRSLEATWKYLLICSVGIALALLGNFFLAVAAHSTSEKASLSLSDLLSVRDLDYSWLKAAFLCLLVGYGTKMGLAPLHTWLPDAHSESPSVVSALLSGALLNCAFLGILRAFQVCVHVGQGAFAQDLLLGLGLLSMGFAAVFILGQKDYKRMLAYSSVEHMGILAVGVGLGGAAMMGSMLHAVNHSLTKAMLFLVAGNILAAYKTKSVDEIRGVSRALPVSGALWVAGFLAITGSPPFGPFLSEFTILKGALDQGRGWVAALYLGLLALVFVGMATTVLRMSQGKADPPAPGGREAALAVVPPAALGLLVLLLGVYVPPPFRQALEAISATLRGSP
jgi:hydrogenase-4 component F